MSGTAVDKMFASHAILSALRDVRMGKRIGVAALAVEALVLEAAENVAAAGL